MKTEQDEVFRGHFEECWAHFAKRFNRTHRVGKRSTAEAKRRIETFCDVGPTTVSAWLRGLNSPQGVAYFKLMCYLESRGYKVIELERLRQPQKGFLELIGYSIISTEEAMTLLNYDRSARLFEALRGTANVNEERQKLMWDAWKERREQLDAKREKLWKKVPRRPEPEDIPTQATPEESSPVVVSTPEVRDVDLRQPTQVIGNLIRALLGLVEDVNFNEAEVEEIREFGEPLARLTFTLSRLTSRVLMHKPRRE